MNLARPVAAVCFFLASCFVMAQEREQTIGDWAMQDVARVSVAGAEVSLPAFKSEGWYKATVLGTVL